MLLDRVLAEAWRRDSPLHGEAHWLAVATTGLDLAAETGADPQIVFAFGLLHDTRRENDSESLHGFSVTSHCHRSATRAVGSQAVG